jgi:hypothetical protein
MNRSSLFVKSTITSVIIVIFLTSWGYSNAEETIFTISPKAAKLNSLAFSGSSNIYPTAPFHGGFQALDVPSNQVIYFTDGQVTEDANESNYECVEKQLRLKATFTDEGEYLRVCGEIENLKPGDRAVILNYYIPTRRKNVTYSNSPNGKLILGNTQIEGNVYPIASAAWRGCCGEEPAVALAIPPDKPCIFGMTGGPQGLGVRFYLGISENATSLGNSAKFEFVIYQSETNWPFRTALKKYYSFYPEYYTYQANSDGFWMCGLEDSVPPNITSYGFNEYGSGASYAQAALDRDDSYGILSFPYTILGQRSIKHLETLPADYNEAIAVLDELCANQTNPELCELINLSCCFNSNDEFGLIPRVTVSSGNHVAFRLNPNPGLGPNSVGDTVLSDVNDKIETYPQIDGIYVDSLGALWPALLNYRAEHFGFAEAPLTFDPNGKVAIHNQLSHYEFVYKLRQNLHQSGRFLMGNGIYSYISKEDPAEHYRAGTRLGRFFLAALCDVGGSEQGINLDQERWEFYRASMGEKAYATLNYKWQDEYLEDVEKLFNKALVYAVFPTNNGGYYPDGYQRDEALLSWFVPKARFLFRKGWEPVTNAVVNSKDVVIERYGTGDSIYFALMSEADQTVDYNISIDLIALGLPQESICSEVARNKSINVDMPGEITLSLTPYETCIIKIAAP